jgi:uncharacterized iron-regulated protein
MGFRIAWLLAAALAAAPVLAAPEMAATDAADHPLAGVIVATGDGARLTPEALAAALGAADMAILGEVHDNPDHHAAQAWLVARMAPGALAFEMLPPSVEGALARARAEGADPQALAQATGWDDLGWPDFAMYAPIFLAAPQVPVTGGAVAAPAIRTAMEQGAEQGARQALGAAAARYGLSLPLPPDQAAAATTEQIAGHCDAIPEAMAARMVEAQRLRDAAFADAALRARAYADQGKVVLIAGSGHARRDRAVPAKLRAAEPALNVATLALVEVSTADDWRAYLGPDADAPPFDYLWFTARTSREDPCEAFLRRQSVP